MNSIGKSEDFNSVGLTIWTSLFMINEEINSEVFKFNISLFMTIQYF